MKKTILLVLNFLLIISLSACDKNLNKDNDSDKAYVKNKGVLNVGMAEFVPMDYREGNDWIGFDADMAKAFADYLEVDINFVQIEWDYKILELDNKNIDCVWNGMSITPEVIASMELSNPYCKNSQVVVVEKNNAKKYDNLDSIKSLNYVVETGSSGETTAKELGLNYITVPQQADALLEVHSKISEACIVDLLMAKVLTKDGASYDNLSNVYNLNEEEYAVGFRKGSDLTNEINSFFTDSYKSGQMIKIAEKYGISDLIIEQK